MFVIRTSYSTNAKGAGQILATVATSKGRRQRTVPFDQSRSSDWNHGNAAGTLALAVDLPWHDGIEHDSNEAGTKHGFAWTPPVLIDLARQAI